MFHSFISTEGLCFSSWPQKRKEPATVHAFCEKNTTRPGHLCEDRGAHRGDGARGLGGAGRGEGRHGPPKAFSLVLLQGVRSRRQARFLKDGGFGLF